MYRIIIQLKYLNPDTDDTWDTKEVEACAPYCSDKCRKKMRALNYFKGPYKNGFFCVKCERHFADSSVIRWFCSNCYEDVCFDCFPGPDFEKTPVEDAPPAPPSASQVSILHFCIVVNVRYFN